MKQPARASTQYGDATGTISLDGFSGLSMFELAKPNDRPKDYFPIGIRISGSQSEHDVESGLSPKLYATLLCVDSQVTGRGVDEIKAYGDKHGSISVFEIDAELDFASFVSLLKRFEIVLIQKPIDECNVQVETGHD